jgi:acyl carrier protein
MQHEIRQYLEMHRADPDSGEFADSDSLLEMGIIDSLMMVDLIAHLEATYVISVDEDDMIPENFDSVDALVAYVERRRAGA